MAWLAFPLHEQQGPILSMLHMLTNLVVTHDPDFEILQQKVSLWSLPWI